MQEPQIMPSLGGKGNLPKIVVSEPSSLGLGKKNKGDQKMKEECKDDKDKEETKE